MALLLMAVGIGFVGVRIFSLSAPTLMWRWQEHQNALRGLESHQTPTWNSGRIAFGPTFVVLGVIWLVVVMSQVLPYL